MPTFSKWQTSILVRRSSDNCRYIAKALTIPKQNPKRQLPHSSPTTGLEWATRLTILVAEKFGAACVDVSWAGVLRLRLRMTLL